MHTPPRIAINCSMLDEHPTGVGVFSYNICNHLHNLYKGAERDRITVFTPTPAYLSRGIRIVKLPRLMLSSRHGKIAAFSRFLWNTFWYPFQAWRYNVLLSPTTHGTFMRTGQIITIHDLLSLKLGNISRHQRFYFKFVLPYLVKRSKAVVAVSETTKKDVVELLNCPPEKVHVIYNGYDPAAYNLDTIPNPDRQNPSVAYGDYLLVIGPTYSHKNIEFLLSVFRDLPSGLAQRFTLVIAGGKKAYLNHLKGCVAQMGLEKRVSFLGYVPAGSMKALYQGAYALIFPSLYEGFGFPLVEAMACGCPVLCSDTASMPEVCGDAAVYFSPVEKQTLKNALEKILGDETLRREMIGRGLQRAKMFSWEKAAASFKQLIDQGH